MYKKILGECSVVLLNESDYKRIILNGLFDKGLINEELYMKCRPKYISSLPGSLNSSDVDELQSRLDAIDVKKEEFQDKIDEELQNQDELNKNIRTHEENIKYYNNQIDEFRRKEEDFEVLNSDLQNEALDAIDEIKSAWNDLMRTNTTNIEPSSMLSMNMNMLGVDEFEFSGVLSSYESDVMKRFADDVDEYFLGVSDEITEWQEEGTSIADEIRSLADKHNVNNRDNGWVEKRDEVSNQDFVSDMRRNIKESEDKIKKNNLSIDESNRRIERYNNAISNLDDDRVKTESNIVKLNG